MVNWLLARSRSLAVVSALAFLPVVAAACSEDAAAPPSDPAVEANDDSASTEQPVTEVENTKVKRQSIGNCWLYATVGWVESLHKGVGGEELDISESYLTYWHWFDQIANNGAYSNEISTGGSWSTAAGIIDRYGLMLEADFIPSEANAESSSRQASALAAINTSLKSGVLKDPKARRDRKILRREMDLAWGLSDSVKKNLDAAFGERADKSLTSKTPSASLGLIKRPTDISVSYRTAPGEETETRTLKDAIGSGSWSRQGPFVWEEVNFPYEDGQERRDYYKRIQRALADSQPVVTSWFVDFNALTSDGAFSKVELDRRGVGRQGGHMTVITDYQIDKVPGFGLLKAGQPATPEQLEAALADEAEIKFFRVKNSWGGVRLDRVPDSKLGGYYDLHIDYIEGPNKKCTEVNGTSDPKQCSDGGAALWDVLLPPGY